MKMEPIVQRFYNSLEEGKITGRKCKECGALEFPPVICCNECSSMDLEWVEISGKAVMTDFVLASTLSTKPENKDLMPYCLACVTLEEGTSLNALVLGVSKKNKQEILARMPVAVKAKIVQRVGFKTVVFELAD